MPCSIMADPERVEGVTSVTTGRSRRFLNPSDCSFNRMIPLRAFQIGMDRIEIGDGRAFLIATPEKALADKLYEDRVRASHAEGTGRLP